MRQKPSSRRQRHDRASSALNGRPTTSSRKAPTANQTSAGHAMRRGSRLALRRFVPPILKGIEKRTEPDRSDGIGPTLRKSRARQRARACSDRGREINRKAVAKYKAAHPDRLEAQKIARRALRRGEIEKPAQCQVVGCTCSEALHIHHVRYDRPKDVVFVCRGHHEEIHHRRALPLRPGAARKIARAPRKAKAA
jgi:hypothetical protein